MSEIAIEVVYALPDQLFLVELRLPPGTTAGEAIERSGVQRHYPDLASGAPSIGIFGCPCEWSTRLEHGDRLEIYRPLSDDIKARRRQRVAEARRKRNGKSA